MELLIYGFCVGFVFAIFLVSLPDRNTFTYVE